MNAMASFIQTCFKINSKVKNKQTKSGKGKSGDFCKSISDPALNLIIMNKSNMKRREKSFSVSEDLALKLKIGPDMEETDLDLEEKVKTETVKTPSCDLLAQLENQVENPSGDNDEMSSSFFDNNGNPVDDENKEAENDEDENEIEKTDKDKEVEPIYFINAATLSEEEFSSVAPHPGYFLQTEKNNFHYDGNLKTNRGGTATIVRPRVPISKSFPDIIQTTMADVQNLKDFSNSAKYNSILPRDLSGMESLPADSLEDMTMAANLEKRNSLSVFNRLSTPNEADTMLTESFAGISGEKPPESWVIDFNSLSLENLDSGISDRPQNKSSNSNSLSFFIKMDDQLTTDDSLSESSTMNSEKKKIFSMFVDIGHGQIQTRSGVSGEKAPSSSSCSSNVVAAANNVPPPVNKPVKNVSCDYTGNNREPEKKSSMRYQNQSLKFSNRVSESSAKNIRSNSMTMTEPAGSNNVLDNMSISNRSSLHVPNESENSIITSSLLSSMETTTLQEEMEICQGGPCFKLGMDLLRMFQEEINTDVNISVRGRWVRAHKCILASRSQYFAAILSGNWVEKAGNTINLDEFSYNVVQFTMYHIYSGTNEIPDTIDLIELATLTDLLGLEGLREVISQTIRTKFCHNFHRPCTGCISGILECFPIAINYGMEDLQRKMTKWICKHFVRVWPTKAFANLGDELIEKCLRYSVNHLSPENLLDITLGCDQLLSTMPTVRWTEIIFSVVNKLSESCVQYVGENLSQVLQSQRFVIFGKGQSWNISRIESTFFGGILLFKPDEACLSHVALTRLIELGTETLDEVEWSTSFVDFLKDLRREVEKFIMANASRSVLSKNWEYLGQDVRKRICSTSFLGMDKHGNKIQKAGTGKNASSQGITNNKITATINNKVRPLSSGSSVSSRRQSSKVTETESVVKIPAKPDRDTDIYAHTDSRLSNSKSVASVRPMPSSQMQRQNVFTERKVTNLTKIVPGHAQQMHPVSSAVGSPMAARMPVSRQSQQSQIVTLRNANSAFREREKSFDTSSRTASSSSTLSRPEAATAVQTPITPSKGIQQFPPAPRTSKAQKQQQQPAPPAPPAKVFLTNSEKAKGVSRPQLHTSQLRGSRSNSVSSGTATMNSSYCRQSSLGSTSTQQSGPVPQATPRTPNLSQPSRYAASLKASNSERVVKASSPLPTPKAQPRQGNRTSNVTSSNVRKTGNIQSTSTTTRVTAGVKPTPAPRHNRGPTEFEATGQCHSLSQCTKSNISDFIFGAGVSNNPDGLMTKSSIEMDTSGSSGEPKIRTLAEIGRSSTFSKDEPTILGKMDISLDIGYNQF